MTVDLKALRSAAEAATRGPWSQFHVPGRERPKSRTGESYGPIDEIKAGLKVVVHWTGFDAATNPKQGSKDARYIALANPAAIIELVDAYERLAAALDKADALADASREVTSGFGARSDVNGRGVVLLVTADQAEAAYREARAALTQAPEAP